MSGREGVGDVVQLHADRESFAGHEGRRGLVAFTVRQVEHAVGNPQRAAVGCDVVEADRHQRHRPVAIEVQLELRGAEQLEAFRQGLGVEAEREGVVDALVDGFAGRIALSVPLAGGESQGLGRRCLDAFLLSGLAPETIACEMKIDGVRVLAAPRTRCHPPTRTLGMEGRRPHPLLHPQPAGRFVHDAVVHAVQPTLPPAKRVLQKADRGAGDPLVGIQVSPRPHRDPTRRGKALHHSEHGVRVAVGPASDRVDRRLDGVEILAHRPVPPVRVAPLVAEPPVHGRKHVLEPGEPHTPPLVADHCRIGGQAQVAQESRAPFHLIVDQAPTGEVHVVAIAIVGGAHGDDRLERRRAERRDLERGEPAPGEADHSDGPAAPGLGGNPGDRLDPVLPLLSGVLVLEQPRRVAGSAEIHSQAGVSVLGEVAVHRLVARAAQVATPVRDVLHDRAHGSLLGMRGKPDPRGEPAPVRQGNPRGLCLMDCRRRGGAVNFRFHRFGSLVSCAPVPMDDSVCRRENCHGVKSSTPFGTQATFQPPSRLAARPQRSSGTGLAAGAKGEQSPGLAIRPSAIPFGSASSLSVPYGYYPPSFPG